MLTADVLVEARRRAGISQRELATRLAVPQSTIARWERGTRTPSLDTAREVVRACGLELSLGLHRYDDSYDPLIVAQLQLSPADRVRAMLQAGSVTPGARAGAAPELPLRALRAVGEAEARFVLIGPLAEAIHGVPLALPAEWSVCAPQDAAQSIRDIADATSEALELHVVTQPSGARGYGDLHRDAQRVQLEDQTPLVASLLDLLRIAEASPEPGDQARVAALQRTLTIRRSRVQ